MSTRITPGPLFLPLNKTLGPGRLAHQLQYGKALQLNTWLLCGVALLAGLNVVAGAAVWKLSTALANQPLRIVKMDELGRTSAIHFDTTASLAPAERERVLRSELSKFAVLHFSRVRSTIQQDYPASLFFLEPRLAEASISANSQARVIETFLADGAREDELAIVKNVTFQELSATPYRAGIDFDTVFTNAATHRESKREHFTAQVAFELLSDVPNEYVKNNPLGVRVVQLRIDKAFQ
jgi:VirB8 protein.